ncbi:MAG: HU family DNA-binding protein [Pseudomonadota bacterium]|nr:HU family DNA-binding protein [Pseudomonadota bacterium]
MGQEGMKAVLDAAVRTITEAAQAGDAMILAGLGLSRMTDRLARQGRNPATGAALEKC